MSQNKKRLKGCSFYPPTNKWSAAIFVDGRKKHLGYFKSEEEAHEAYLNEKILSQERKREKDYSEYCNVPGYDGRYKISKDGVVISYANPTIVELKNKIHHGRLHVSLSKDSQSKDRNISLHRLLYITFIGPIPDKMEIDHIDRNPLNNNLNNLRCVTRSQNEQNKFVKKGYGYNKRDKLWQAKITVSGKKIILGCFKNEDDARAAYIEGKKKYHGIDIS